MKSRNKGKGGPVIISKKVEIKTKLKELILGGELGRSNSISFEELADKYNTTRQTISNYVTEIYSKVPPEEIEKAYIDFRIIFDKLEREVEDALHLAITVKERVMVINTYFKLVKEKIELMESFSKKAKVADKVDLTADITQRSISVQIIDDRTKVIKAEE